MPFVLNEMRCGGHERSGGYLLANSAKVASDPGMSQSSSCSTLIRSPRHASIALFVFSTWPRPRWFSTTRIRGIAPRGSRQDAPGDAFWTFVVADHHLPVGVILLQHVFNRTAYHLRSAEGWIATEIMGGRADLECPPTRRAATGSSLLPSSSVHVIQAVGPDETRDRLRKHRPHRVAPRPS